MTDSEAMKLPHRVQMSVVEQYEDGSTIQIDYEDLPLPANDPYVRRRKRPIDGVCIVRLTELLGDRPDEDGGGH